MKVISKGVLPLISSGKNSKIRGFLVDHFLGAGSLSFKQMNRIRSGRVGWFEL